MVPVKNYDKRKILCRKNVEKYQGSRKPCHPRNQRKFCSHAIQECT